MRTSSISITALTRDLLLAALLAAAGLGPLGPRPAHGQAAAGDTAAADTVSTDSLAREIEHLRARIDSLAAVLSARAADTASAGADELSALRAAARQAAERTAPDTGEASRGSRTRNLNRLNPEISLTGDALGLYTDPAGGDGGLRAVPREFELSIQSALDPYSRAKVFIAHHEDFEIAGLSPFGHGHAGEGGHDEDEGTGHGEEHGEEDAGAEADAHGGGFEIEEGYIHWVGLPGGLGAKVGKFRQEVGLYNRWHNHALLEVQRPLPLLAFLGADGLSQTGLGLALPSVTTGAGTQTAYLEITTGTNERLFEGGDELSYLGRVESFWDLSPSTFLQLGATGVYGENDQASLVTRLLQFDAYFRWQPSGDAMYRDFRAKAAWYLVEKEERGLPETSGGGYLQLNYQLDRSWVIGGRADYLTDFGEHDEEIVQLVPSVTWWQSEWVRLRLQYNHVAHDDRPNHSLVFQTVWAVGPHKHETY